MFACVRSSECEWCMCVCVTANLRALVPSSWGVPPARGEGIRGAGEGETGEGVGGGPSMVDVGRDHDVVPGASFRWGCDHRSGRERGQKIPGIRALDNLVPRLTRTCRR